MYKTITSLPLLATILAAVVAPLGLGVQQDAYAQGAAFYDEINEEQQALISEVLNRLQNQTADRISIFEDPANMIIAWTENVTAVAPDGTAFDISRETSVTAPHNLTSVNGYVYRDGTIFKPDGTELFTQ
jgi:hypothetical protein